MGLFHYSMSQFEILLHWRLKQSHKQRSQNKKNQLPSSALHSSALSPISVSCSMLLAPKNTDHGIL